MSSISISANDFSVRPVRAVRLTRRGKFVLFAAFLALAAVFMVALGGLADAGSPQQVREIQVVPGQTLTDIARQVGGHADVRDTIAEIERMNGMSGAALQIGQHLVLPVR